MDFASADYSTNSNMTATARNKRALEPEEARVGTDALGISHRAMGGKARVTQLWLLPVRRENSEGGGE